MENKKRTTPVFVIIAATAAVGLIVFILNDGGYRYYQLFVKLIRFIVINAPGEDLAAFFLVAVVFSVGAVAALAYFIPKVRLQSERGTKIGKGVLKLFQISLVAPPIATGVAVSLKLSLWFIVPVLILTFIGSLFIISRAWTLLPGNKD